jgi:predicted RNase H-like HicB family nuclease
MSDKTATTTPPAVEPVTVHVTVRMKALAFPDPKGGYAVIIPALGGIATQGETMDEVEAMTVEVAELVLDSNHDDGKAEAIRLVNE